MGTLDANGIYMYDDTDGAPTPPTLNLGQQSVSNAIGNIRVTQVVADTPALNALIASFVPTPSKPLYVHVQNRPVGQQLLVSTGGTPQVVLTATTASRWTNLSLYNTPPTVWTKLPDAYAAPAQIMVSDGWAKCRGLIRAAAGGVIFGGGLLTIAPVGMRPQYTHHCEVSSQYGHVTLSVDAAGEVKFSRHENFAAPGWLDLTMLTWPIATTT